MDFNSESAISRKKSIFERATIARKELSNIDTRSIFNKNISASNQKFKLSYNKLKSSLLEQPAKSRLEQYCNTNYSNNSSTHNYVNKENLNLFSREISTTDQADDCLGSLNKIRPNNYQSSNTILKNVTNRKAASKLHSSKYFINSSSGSSDSEYEHFTTNLDHINITSDSDDASNSTFTYGCNQKKQNVMLDEDKSDDKVPTVVNKKPADRIIMHYEIFVYNKSNYKLCDSSVQTDKPPTSKFSNILSSIGTSILNASNLSTNNANDTNNNFKKDKLECASTNISAKSNIRADALSVQSASIANNSSNNTVYNITDNNSVLAKCNAKSNICEQPAAREVIITNNHDKFSVTSTGDKPDNTRLHHFVGQSFDELTSARSSFKNIDSRAQNIQMSSNSGQITCHNNNKRANYRNTSASDRPITDLSAFKLNGNSKTSDDDVHNITYKRTLERNNDSTTADSSTESSYIPKNNRLAKCTSDDNFKLFSLQTNKHRTNLHDFNKANSLFCDQLDRPHFNRCGDDSYFDINSSTNNIPANLGNNYSSSVQRMPQTNHNLRNCGVTVHPPCGQAWAYDYDINCYSRNDRLAVPIYSIDDVKIDEIGSYEIVVPERVRNYRRSCVIHKSGNLLSSQLLDPSVISDEQQSVGCCMKDRSKKQFSRIEPVCYSDNELARTVQTSLNVKFTKCNGEDYMRNYGSRQMTVNRNRSHGKDRNFMSLSPNYQLDCGSDGTVLSDSVANESAGNSLNSSTKASKTFS